MYEKLTFITGTVRRNRKGIPPVLKEKFEIGQETYLRKDNLLFLGFREKKTHKDPVILLPSKHTARSIEKKNKKEKKLKCSKTSS